MKKLLLAATVLLSLSAQAATVTYYGDKFHGRKTASGERFNQNAMTCASNSHKMGTLLEVTNVKNGKSVVCRVNDTGGFSKYGVSLDLSKGAFAKIAPLSQGRAQVSIRKVSGDEMQASNVASLAQQKLNEEKVAAALAAIEPVTISQTATISLAANVSATQ
ncbi:septal ring lytic transglycosylase RlpA family protein [Moraxella sp. FZLJ2107]|uniref:septal ring lytic transglycosylase RlpA family protein n=1 Tax=unclassified Moraxella TaxID=2685852 RepID=UPI0020C8EFE6|nr:MULTISPECIES: septal ring lytic transglycosylase RlpA family protein [unclassified Moraxella]UTO04404.1 septal ring lytic transglycosylase RlpA family protein [Moraxella sp. FZLJ2107]UTO23237.1 septal ring lytic transglycosylase RlpA family protein [Moraxella sp. FZLJ2109]